MQQPAHKNPWKTALVIVGFVFLTAALSTAGWFYRYSQLQEVPRPSAQTPRTARPVARIMADPQAAMAPVTGTPGNLRSLPEQIPARPSFEISLDPIQEFQEDLRKALLHDLVPVFPELPKFLEDPMAKARTRLANVLCFNLSMRSRTGRLINGLQFSWRRIL